MDNINLKVQKRKFNFMNIFWDDELVFFFLNWIKYTKNIYQE